ncbi:MAG: hypothetical protein JXM71_04055 [Spirochaetales bacterium]|nr:hypothetical protein [Spirochaetales bacterium]
MFRYLVSVFLAFSIPVFAWGAPGASAAEVTTWWSRATKAYGLADSYSASRTTISIEELDESGAVKSYERGETRLDWSGEQPRVIVVTAEKNGKDVTAEWRKRYGKSPPRSQDGSSSGGPPAGFDATPFDPKYASALTRGAVRAIAGGVEVPYFIKTDGGPVEGIVTFSSSGDVLEAAQSWTDPPFYVSYMKSVLSYGYQGQAMILSAMNIEGEASVLFVKKRFRMSFEFSDWKPKQTAGS